METLFVAGYGDIAEAGFPDVLCPVIFLEGCNFKCPYCLNAKLVRKENNKKIPLDFIIEKYKGKEEKILISGGEPLNNERIYEYIEKLKNNGFQVRISTNGSFPVILQNLIFHKMVSFVAMDVKTGFCDLKKWDIVSDKSCVFYEILESIDILNSENVDHEFRTTLFPELVDEQDIISISTKIKNNSNWFLQKFRMKNNLLGCNLSDKIKLYEKEDVQKLLNIARQKIKNTRIRYV
jgi:pyruvate formate lyase activating enzyme